MKLEGIHHVTAITADGPRNADFYARALGLRLIKKTVNFDQPEAYHLYYGDEEARPGAAMTFFEFPDAARGKAGAGMVHRIAWRARDEAALTYWADRLAAEGIESGRTGDSLVFSDPEGLGLELVVDPTGDKPLAADDPEVPAEHALLGFHGVRAYTADPERSTDTLEHVLDFEGGASTWEARGDRRGGLYTYDAASSPGFQGAGTVHHVAWASLDEDHGAWRARAAEAGLHVTPIIDRQYFRSIYFREPSGVLFEIATMSPGFEVDEPMEALGRRLMLPPQHEPRRAELERTLTPIVDPRAAARAG